MKKKEFFDSFLSLFFPKVCPVCLKRADGKDRFLCQECETKLNFIESPVCWRCGFVFKNNPGRICYQCQESYWFFDKSVSIFYYDKILRKIIHCIKYHEMTNFIKFFNTYFVKFFDEFNPFEKIDLITSVPLHFVKEKQRGFNQAHLFCLQLKDLLNVQYIPMIVKRVRFTQTQTKLTREKRMRNIKGAFRIKKNLDLKGKNILVFDDIFTSGSTINEVSKEIRKLEPNNIFALTLARR